MGIEWLVLVVELVRERLYYTMRSNGKEVCKYTFIHALVHLYNICVLRISSLPDIMLDAEVLPVKIAPNYGLTQGQPLEK